MRTGAREVARPLATSPRGRRAGFVSRVAADGIDVVGVIVAEFGLVLLFAVTRFFLTRELRIPRPPSWLSVAGFCVLLTAYLASSWTLSGKTLGKQVAGVRVVATNGDGLGPWRALCRAVLCVAFPLGLAWTLVSRRNASLQDLLLGTAVVYDWTPRRRAP